MRLISAGSGVQVPAPPPIPSAHLSSDHLTSCTSDHRISMIGQSGNRAIGSLQSAIFNLQLSAIFNLPPSMSVLTRALRTIRRHRMVPYGGRVVVALSGGPDSVALLHVLLELQAQGELVVAGIAHFNHQLRGADADADEQFCRDLAASLDVPFQASSGDVRARAKNEHRSIEDAARAARYEFLADAARVLNAF